MAYDFPASPTEDQEYTPAGGVTYIYKAPRWTVKAINSVTSVTGTAPVVSSGGSTPAISMAAATTSVPGYLTSADWNTFNGKAPLASPVFTGDPQAPTPATADNDTSIATTAFCKAAIIATGAVAMVAASAPASPVTGQIWWESDAETLHIWNGTAWRPVVGT
jgi:hypothetical protein